MLKRKTPLKAKSGFKRPTIEQMAESGLLQRGSTFKAKPKRLPVRKKREGPTQMDVFREIWAEREHVCEVCGAGIPFASPGNFFHILPKGSYPRFKLLKDNILITCCFNGVSEGCHELFHQMGNKLRGNKKWKSVFQKIDSLKGIYNENR